MEFSEFTQKISALPSLSPSTREAFEIIDNHDVTVADVAELLEKDPGMVARILQMANSAAYGFSSQIKTVRDAMLRIGLSHTKNIIVMSTLFDDIGKSDLSGEIRRHGVAVSKAGKIYAKKSGYPKADDCGAVGLVHDIGRVIFLLYEIKELKSQKPALPDEWKTEEEMSRYGTTHSEIGGVVLGEWKFPEIYGTIVASHHRTEGLPAGFDKPILALYLSEMSVDGIGTDKPPSKDEAERLADALKRLNIPKAFYEETSNRIREEMGGY